MTLSGYLYPNSSWHRCSAHILPGWMLLPCVVIWCVLQYMPTKLDNYKKRLTSYLLVKAYLGGKYYMEHVSLWSEINFTFYLHMGSFNWNIPFNSSIFITHICKIFSLCLFRTFYVFPLWSLWRWLALVIEVSTNLYMWSAGPVPHRCKRYIYIYIYDDLIMSSILIWFFISFKIFFFGMRQKQK